MPDAGLIERQNEAHCLGPVIKLLDTDGAVAIDREIAEKFRFIRQVRFPHERNDDALSLLFHEPFEDPPDR